MQYLGGKSKIAKRLAEAILLHTDHRERLIEPFCGGGAMTAVLVPHFKEVFASDIHLDLILMWQAVQKGWVPPSNLTEDEYKTLRHAPSSALRGFVGFGCSFGGKWFGGYARGSGLNYADQSQRNVIALRNHIDESARNVIAGRLHLNKVTFLRCDYRTIQPVSGDVIYCDPPYANTTGYSHGDFNHEEFWGVMRKWACVGATVFVSEYTAPNDTETILEITRTRDMKGDHKTSAKVTEKLFRVPNAG